MSANEYCLSRFASVSPKDTGVPTLVVSQDMLSALLPAHPLRGVHYCKLRSLGYYSATAEELPLAT